MYDIAVIGAGVVGGMIARELTRCKVSVCILEKQHDVAMGASKANSGLINALYRIEDALEVVTENRK